MSNPFFFKILCVDDDEISLKLMEKYLAPEGYRVMKAKNGAQALEMLPSERFSLIITDVTMPRIGGLQLLEQVQRKYRIPAIVVTASDIDSRTQRKSFSLGALRFMLKPVDKDELRSAVKEILGNARLLKP